MSDNFDVISGRAASFYAGDLTRTNQPYTTVSGFASSTQAPTAFGVPLSIDTNGNYQTIQSTDTSATVFGFLVRVFPTQGLAGGTTLANLNAGLGAGSPDNSQPLSVLQNGYIAVKVSGSTAPKKGGAVYIQTTADTGLALGAVSAALDSGTPNKNFALTGAFFTGGWDANNVAEIFFQAQV